VSAVLAEQVPVARRSSVSLVRRSLRLWRTRIGLAITGALVALAVFGPAIAPFGPQQFAGSPYQSRGGTLWFGADNLGQDVWSRFLDGGRSILVVSVLSTVLGVGVGVLVGLSAALARRSVDELLMRAVDLLLAFPSILLALVAVTTVGPKNWLIVVTVAATTMPRTARVMRGAGVSVVERDFVAAARSIGDGHFRVLFAEVLPNVTGTLVVEATLRLTYAIGLIAALAFLGVTTNPNGADWGTMVQENSGALILQPWGCLLPAIAIGLLTVGTGLVGDGLARASSGIDRGV
jgi:peptide/nickel transport system permease protein